MQPQAKSAYHHFSCFLWNSIRSKLLPSLGIVAMLASPIGVSASNGAIADQAAMPTVQLPTETKAIFQNSTIETWTRNKLGKTDLDFIYLKELEDITFFNCLNVGDISDLIMFPNLKRVLTSKVTNPDLSMLAGAADLSVLVLQESNVNSLSGLEQKEKLVAFINKENTNLTDVSILSTCPNLRMIDITKGNVPDLTPLSNLPLLTELRVGGNPIEKVGPLDGLAILGLNYSTARQFHLFAGMIPELKELDVSSVDLDQQAYNTIVNSSIVYLHARGYEESQLIPFRLMESLEYLDASFGLYTDPSFLASFDLTYGLDISHTSVKSIDAFRNKEYAEFSLGSTAVEDLSPLLTMGKLERTDFFGCYMGITDDFANQLMESNPDLVIYAFERGARTFPNYILSKDSYEIIVKDDLQTINGKEVTTAAAQKQLQKDIEARKYILAENELIFGPDAEQLVSGLSNEEIVLAVKRHLASNYEYDYDTAENNPNLYSAAPINVMVDRGMGTCYSNVIFMKELLQLNGVDALYFIGKDFNWGDMNHAWLMVQDSYGEWHHVEPLDQLGYPHAGSLPINTDPSSAPSGGSYLRTADLKYQAYNRLVDERKPYPTAFDPFNRYAIGLTAEIFCAVGLVPGTISLLTRKRRNLLCFLDRLIQRMESAEKHNYSPKALHKLAMYIDEAMEQPVFKSIRKQVQSTTGINRKLQLIRGFAWHTYHYEVKLSIIPTQNKLRADRVAQETVELKKLYKYLTAEKTTPLKPPCAFSQTGHFEGAEVTRRKAAIHKTPGPYSAKKSEHAISVSMRAQSSKEAMPQPNGHIRTIVVMPNPAALKKHTPTNLRDCMSLSSDARLQQIKRRSVLKRKPYLHTLL